jgi:hydroxylamine reductase
MTDDFTPVIEAALAPRASPRTEGPKPSLTGFGHNAVLGVADEVIEAVKSGAMKHFFLIGGCDGAKSRPQLLHRVRRSRAG